MKIKFETLKEQLLMEMARIGITEDGYEVWIRTDDPGKIPHFHYWDRATKGDEFHTCIQIEKPRYFLHEGKEDILNSKQKKLLIKMFKTPYKRNTEITLFQHLIEEWNDNNSDVEVKETLEMPDYMKLSERK